ncbi:MAG: ATP-dependent helicase, partial [Fischerella thermalis M48_A2018_028]|nr:ATP-dependent helicase [Fischerella thermalis M48_A2018_028]
MAILHGSWLLQNQGNCLFIWGETWRSLGTNIEPNTLTEIPPLPYAIAPAELSEWLSSRNITIPNSTQHVEMQSIASGRTKRGQTTTTATKTLPTSSQITIALPTDFAAGETEGTTLIHPVHSAALSLEKTSYQYLHPWKVEGFCLNPTEAIKFLTSLPLSIGNSEDDFVGGDLRFWSHIARWSLDLISRCKFLPTLERQADGSFTAKWQALLDSALDGTRLEKFSQQMPLACRTYQGGGEIGRLGDGEKNHPI